MRTFSRWLWRSVAALALLYLVHLAPEPRGPVPAGDASGQFQWRRDAYWQRLETEFVEDRAAGCAGLAETIESVFSELQLGLDRIAETNLPPDAALFDSVETNFFQLAPLIGACPERLPDYLLAFTRLRELIKRQSESWPMESVQTRRRLYQTIYGGRAAVEEALLQAPPGDVRPLMLGADEPSTTPSAQVRGVTLHSGDILVSRGGAPTSALIARGNDFTGNFSHVALVHVDEQTRRVSVVESHIESGVGVFPIEHYLGQTKLRIMVLRLRADLPLLMQHPDLPHAAASAAMAQAQARHIPYDFAMDYTDPSKQFCSEVASAAYRPFGLTLWMGMSHLSAPGVTAWLSALGARHFETQEPSDLEYDPQLRVVAEWHDPETLLKDHVDNAVTDVLLERADAGEVLDYDCWKLPFVRGLKAWSIIKNGFGAVGPIPEGMSATTALRVDRLTKRHELVAARVISQVNEFKARRGYLPPYWELVRMAREARDE